MSFNLLDDTVRDSKHNSSFEGFLFSDEKILWSGKPSEIPFAKETTLGVFLSAFVFGLLCFCLCLIVAIIKASYSLPDFAVVPVGPVLVLLIFGMMALRKINNVENTTYFITTRRIIEYDTKTKAIIVEIAKEKVKHVSLVNSRIDRKYNVDSIIVNYDYTEDSTFTIQSVPNGKEAINLIRAQGI